jgi:hypothetical protein
MPPLLDSQQVLLMPGSDMLPSNIVPVFLTTTEHSTAALLVPFAVAAPAGATHDHGFECNHPSPSSLLASAVGKTCA